MSYKKYTIDKLREVCKSYNLSQEGRKDELINRIVIFEKMKKPPLGFEVSESKADIVAVSQNISKAAMYIRLKVDNLFRYLNSGVFYPLHLEMNQVYKLDNRKKDFFNLAEDYIPVLPKIFETIEEDDIYVEIASEGLKIETFGNNDISFLVHPLPVSRIENIYFISETQRINFISTVKIYPDFFIPTAMLKVAPASMVHSGGNFEFGPSLLPNVQLESWIEPLKRYDRIMGMFSFMRNVGIFYSELEEQYQEFTRTYFSALGMINRSFDAVGKRDPGLFRYILFPSEIDDSSSQRYLFKKVLNVIYANEEFSFEVAKRILEQTADSKLASQSEKELISQVISLMDKLQNHQTTYATIFKIEAVRNNYPLLALVLLARFPNKSRQHSDKQSVRVFFLNQEFGFSKGLVEFLLAVFGLYYGYKTMIKSDTNLALSDTLFASLSAKQQSIKFRLETSLERVIIESIFIWCRTQAVVSEIKVDLSTNITREIPRTTQSQSNSYSYQDKSFKIQNTIVTIVERRSRVEEIVEVLQKAYPKKIYSNSLLLLYLMNLSGVDQDFIVHLIKTNIGKIDLDRVLSIIDIDKSQRK